MNRQDVILLNDSLNRVGEDALRRRQMTNEQQARMQQLALESQLRDVQEKRNEALQQHWATIEDKNADVAKQSQMNESAKNLGVIFSGLKSGVADGSINSDVAWKISKNIAAKIPPEMSSMPDVQVWTSALSGDENPFQTPPKTQVVPPPRILSDLDKIKAEGIQQRLNEIGKQTGDIAAENTNFDPNSDADKIAANGARSRALLNEKRQLESQLNSFGQSDAQLTPTNGAQGASPLTVPFNVQTDTPSSPQIAGATNGKMIKDPTTGQSWNYLGNMADPSQDTNPANWKLAQ